MNNEDNEIKKGIKEVTFWRVALPMLSLIIVNTFSAPINTFIASGVSSTGVESVGTAGGVLMMFGVLLSLLTGGAGIVIGQYIGKKSTSEKLKKVVDSTFFVSVFQGVFLAALVTPLAKPLLKCWGMEANTEQMAQASQYIYILAPTFIIISIQGYFLSTSAIYGHPMWVLVIGLSTTFIDMALSSLFVFVCDMDVLGVIIGTVIARAISLLASMFAYSKYVQRFWKINQYDWPSIKQIMRISVPIAGEKINWNAGQFVNGILIGQLAMLVGLNIYGHNYMLWSRAIFNSIAAIVLVAGVAFGIAVEQVVPRRMGEGNLAEAKKIVFRAYLYAVIIDVTLCVIVFFVAPYIVELLSKQETNKVAVDKLQAELKWPFLVLIPLEIGRAANIVYIAACRSAGDSKFTAFASVPITWIGQILIVWLLVQYGHLGYLGVVIGLAFDECVRGIVNYLRWKSGKWKVHLEKLHTTT